MKRVGVLLGMVLAVAGVAQSSVEDETQTGDYAVGIEDGNEYMVTCTQAGIAYDLTGDDLDAYVRDCMGSMSTGQDISIGE